MCHVQLASDLVATDMEQRERNNAITLHFTCPSLEAMAMAAASLLAMAACSLSCSLFLFS